MRTRSLLLALGATLPVAAVPALASTPSSGTVSTASPTFEWTGTSNAYLIKPLQTLVTSNAGQGGPCEAPYCDTFTLEVADQADLKLTADNVDDGGPGADSIQMDVLRPDGTTLYVQGEDGAPIVARIKKAATGSYGIQVWVNQPTTQDGTFHASAVLGSTTTPAPASPQPAPAPPPAGVPAATLSLKTSKASAKKVGKALKLSIGSSKPVTDVRVALKKGKTVLGTAKLASMGTSGTLKLKLKKALKKGAYTVAVVARDGDRDVGLTARLTVKK